MSIVYISAECQWEAHIKRVERPPAPAVWLGYQHQHGVSPPVELYVLTKDIGGHPLGSTVSRRTLEADGFNVPPVRAAA